MKTVFFGELVSGAKPIHTVSLVVSPAPCLSAAQGALLQNLLFTGYLLVSIRPTNTGTRPTDYF